MQLKSDKTKGVRFKDLSGKRFGKLVVVSFAGNSNNGHSKWNCICDCGKECVSFSTNLIRGMANSCGCIKSSVLGIATTTHGKSKTRMFKIWVGIKKRCYNENSKSYKWYGGKGVRVCKSWLEGFQNFYNDMIDGYSDTLTLERENPNGDYEKSNCKWATYTEQARNKTNSVYYEVNGERKTLAEWSEITGVNSSTISNRIKVGWPSDRIFDKPKRKVASMESISMYLIV